MAVKLQSVASDLEKESNGDIQPSTLYPGVVYRVRSVHYEPYATARDLALQALARQYVETPIPREASVNTAGRLLADHLLLGWSGFDEAYTPDVASRTLTNPAFRELVADIELACRKAGKKQLEFETNLVKN